MRTRKEQIEKIIEAMKDYTLLHTYGDDGYEYPLIDALTPDGRTVDVGESECGELAAELYDSVIAPHILEAELRAEQRVRAEIARELKNPECVHVNMLRGEIAAPSWSQLLHLFPKEYKNIRRDSERLDWLESGCCDVRFRSEPIADTGDADVYCDIVQHHMAKPRERVIGSSETIRAAIDTAREVG
jgi:hypothetical protein